MSTPLVSVIVPVYNCERFLADCLDSLLAQKLPSFEIICVDDGSTDGSPAILEAYASRCSQIWVVHQKNSGVSAARNSGLSLAKGKYLCFCDSDDLLLDGNLPQAVQCAQAQDAQLCFFEMRRVAEEYAYCREAASDDRSVTRGFDEALLKNLYVFTLLISRELLRSSGARFREGLAYSEDELFFLDLLCSADPKKVLHLHGDGYLHRKNTGSVMNASKWHRAPRHYEAMKVFATELGKRMSPEDVVQKELRRRRHQAVSNALYAGFFMEKPVRQILTELEAMELYPYPLQWKTLKPSNIKNTVSNYVRFLFPVRGYYLLVCKLVRLGLKLYKKE